VAFSAKRNLLVSSDEGGEVIVWEVATARMRGYLRKPASAVYSLAFSPDGNSLAIAGDGGLTVWDVADIGQ
jgi:WD40 repeat protein